MPTTEVDMNEYRTVIGDSAKIALVALDGCTGIFLRGAQYDTAYRRTRFISGAHIGAGYINSIGPAIIRQAGETGAIQDIHLVYEADVDLQRLRILCNSHAPGIPIASALKYSASASLGSRYSEGWLEFHMTSSRKGKVELVVDQGY
jgi:hypothetical protein